jgi:cellulose synthase/poly-beta-1,6-N-acetylglucosamine synthase-like glycosyltransferase
MILLYKAIVLFLTVKLSGLIVNLFQFPVLSSPSRHRSSNPAATPVASPKSAGQLVSLLIPMRDEGRRLPATLPSLLSQDSYELLILDDESSDGSAALAGELMKGHPHARVIGGRPAPAGWVGKNWACHQLAGHASGSILVFCDADILLAPGAVTAVIAEMAVQRADVFSVFPRQITKSTGEHLLVPLIDDVLLCFLPFFLLSRDVPAAATANGSLIAFTQSAYRHVGGFAAVRSELVEDVAIARHARRAGLVLGLALGGDLVQTRMYQGYHQVVAGLSRGLVSVTGGSRVRLGLTACWHVLAYTVPVLLVARDRRWLLPLGLAMTERALVETKTGRRRIWQACLTPLAPLAAIPLYLQAMRGTQHWAGRRYS